MSDRHMPDKAIDVIDEAGAAQRLLAVSKRKKPIGVHEVDNVVAQMARIPTKTISTSDMDVLKTLDRDLKLLIFGQDDAI